MKSTAIGVVDVNVSFGPAAVDAPTVSPAFVGLSIELYNALPMLGSAARFRASCCPPIPGAATAIWQS